MSCQVSFDDRVIELFYDQTLDASFASRHNIRRILMYQYDRLARRLGHPPTKKEIDRNCVIGSDIYATCFGSWKIFEETMAGSKDLRYYGIHLGNVVPPVSQGFGGKILCNGDLQARKIIVQVKRAKPA